jgi:hypothetical protein
MRLEARQRRMARAAYVTSPGACNGVAHSHDYSQGFEDGYYDVASGGDGCPPPLPPKKYWGVAYQSPVGQEHIKAWFQGFRDGAAAAKADGAAAYGTIYISDEHRKGMKRAADAEGANHRMTPQSGTPGPVPPVPGAATPITPGAPVQILGPTPVLPPIDNLGKPPMSDAHKAPPLRDIQNPPPPAPPPSAKRPETTTPDPMFPGPMASTPKAPPPIPATATIRQVDAKVPTPASEPVKLKLPELELPAGFVPEANLGEPQPVTNR